MSEFGLKIKSIEVAPLYYYNLGLRNRYDTIDAMFCNSLFSNFIRKHGLKDYKGESTRDIICLSFGFGTRSYEEEIAHLNSLLENETDSTKIDNIKKHIQKCNADKDKYRKLSRAELRDEIYNNGIVVPWHNKNYKTGEITIEPIKYRMLYRNPSKAKVGKVMFIREDLYNIAHNWLTMGIKMPQDNAKIVEMSAYAPLSTSTIEYSFRMPIKDVLILKDQKSFFNTITKVVNEKNGVCYVDDTYYDVANEMWDGMALIDEGACPSMVNGMALLRNHFFKACAFKTKIQQFFKDYYGEEYNTAVVKDMFGRKHRVRDIKLITTNNACKWLKFKDLMGGGEYEAYQYWSKKVRADGQIWGIVKTDHPSKLGSVQQMSYQMVNTLPITKEEVAQIADTSVTYVETLKFDNEVFVDYLWRNSNVINHYEMLATLYERYPTIANSNWWRTEKKEIINQYVNKLRTGKITVEGDNLTVCGNPYALLLYTVGADWESDPTLNFEQGTIQCYTPRFADGEYLCAIRSPENSQNNIAYLHNTYSYEIQKYFSFSNNIMAVNCIHSDVQARMNGEDFDSDFNFVTNNAVMVKAARECYLNYPTVVNNISDSTLVYTNDLSSYAQMDTNLAKAQRDIGESSNLAQLAITYYFTELAKPQQDELKLKELSDNFVILAVLAQIAIDSTKRQFSVNVTDEIARIKKMDCMNMEDKKDFPLFMKYTKDIPLTDGGGKSLPYETIKKSRDKLTSRINYDLECPMNWLQDCFTNIRRTSNTRTIDISNYVIDKKMNIKKFEYTKIGKICKIIKDYSNYVANYVKLDTQSSVEGKETFMQITCETEEVISSIRKMNISNNVMLYLIKASMNIPIYEKYNHITIIAKNKIKRKLLNILFHSNKERFLNFFGDFIQKNA